MGYSHTVLWVSTLITMGGCSSGVIGGCNNEPTRNANGGCPYNVSRGDPNSWLLLEPEMHLVFWGNYPEANKDLYQFVWGQLLNHGTVLQRLSEYGIRGGTLDVNNYSNNPNDVLPNADGGSPTNQVNDAGITLLDDNEVPQELNNEILAGLLPYPNDNTIYVIMLPPGTLTNNQFSSDEGGYHGHAMYGNQRYTYAIISNHGEDWNFTNLIISHELGEAATDPDLSTGWRDYNLGHGSPEIGDICTYIPVQVNGYQVQKFWSNAACVCQ